ncbi:molecular chaperone DnaK [Acidobacteria bacterium AH-259-A15]|nr:molecular chaperone DnaK [Acidobacteria bacterium AH-259-A15]
MSKAIGIDLGTTFSVAAYAEGGRVKVIPNAEGDHLTPSVAAFTRDESLLVGKVARAQAVANPERTIASIKRRMGSNKKIVIGRQELAPQEISSFILAKIKRDIEEALGQPLKKVVITVPAYFGDNQRQATIEAGKLAGLEVMRIVSEPTAAALAYGLHLEDIHHILVWDLGGGTFDVSILELGDGVFEVKAVNGNTHLGGDDWDQKIVDYLVEEIKTTTGIDVSDDRKVLQKLKEVGEKAKIELSVSTVAKIRVPIISNGTDFGTTLTRTKFEELGKDLLKKMVEPTKQALADARLKADDIDKIVLVGGSTRMPSVQNLVRELFGKEPYKNINPDEVVAVGAAVQAGVLLGEIKDIALVDVIALSLGIEAQEGIFAKIIERNSAIPMSAGQIFTTAKDNQPQVDVRIFQGERALTVDNGYLGEFTLDNIPPAKRGIPSIEVTFHVDANGVIAVSALDLHTEREKSVTIKSPQRMTGEQIQRSIKEAEKYAAEDDQCKERIYLGIRAGNMIAAAEMVLEKNESLLSRADVEELEASIFTVQEALASGDSEEIELRTKELKELVQLVSDQVKPKKQFQDVDMRIGV